MHTWIILTEVRTCGSTCEVRHSTCMLEPYLSKYTSSILKICTKMAFYLSELHAYLEHTY